MQLTERRIKDGRQECIRSKHTKSETGMEKKEKEREGEDITV